MAHGDSVEYMVNAHTADALVCISNCDKITPGMLNAALRESGAEVVGVATVVDRATGEDKVIAEEGLEYRYLLSLEDLDLA